MLYQCKLGWYYNLVEEHHEWEQEDRLNLVKITCKLGS